MTCKLEKDTHRIQEATNLCPYYLNNCFADTNIRFVNKCNQTIQVIHAHKLALAQSGYFNERLRLNQPIVIQVENNRLQYLLDAVGYLYGCPLLVRSEQILPFYEIATKLQIVSLKEKMKQLIEQGELELSVLVEMANKAWSENGELKYELANKLIVVFDTKEPELLAITNPELMAYILGSDRINVNSEVEVLRFVERWAQGKPRESVEKVIPMIRLATIVSEKRGIELVDLLSGSPLNSYPIYKAIVKEATEGEQKYGVVLPNRRNIPRYSVVDRLLSVDPKDTYYARISNYDCKRPDTEFTMTLTNKAGERSAKLEKNSDLCAIPIGVGSLIEVKDFHEIDLGGRKGIEVTELIVIYPNTSQLDRIVPAGMEIR